MNHKDIEKTLAVLSKRVDEQDDLIERLNAKVVMLTLQGTPVNIGVDMAAPAKAGMSMTASEITMKRVEAMRSIRAMAKPGEIIQYDRDDKVDAISFIGNMLTGSAPVIGKKVGITIMDDITA